MSRRARRVWLTIAGVVAIGVAAIPVAYYAFLRPAVLNARLRLALAERGLEVARLGAVEYEFPAAFRIETLEIAPRGGEDARPAWRLDIGQARLAGGFGALLTGDWTDGRLILKGADLAVFAPAPPDRDSAAEAARRNAAAMSAALHEAADAVEAILPDIEFEDVVVRWFVREARGPRLLERWILHGGLHTAEGVSTLQIRRRRFPEEDLLRLTHEHRADLWTVQTGVLELATLRDYVPELAQIMDRTGARGAVRVRRAALTLPPAGAVPATFTPQRVELELQDLSLTLPLEDGFESPAPGNECPPTSRYARFSGLAATVDWAPGEFGTGRAAVDLTGSFRNGAVRGQLAFLVEFPGAARAAPAGTPLRLESVDLEFTGLDAPTRAAHPQFFASRALGDVLSDFLDRYQPDGVADVHVVLPPPSDPARRAAESDGVPAWRGTVQVRAMRCRYEHFPYDFSHVSGLMTFERGATTIHQLRAQHGAATVFAAGLVENPAPWTGFSLQISAQNVALDRDLYAALPPTYQKVWAEAAPLGLADLELNLTRRNGSAETGPAEPDVTLDAELRGGALTANDRRLHVLNGRLVVEDGAIAFDDFSGQRSGGNALFFAGALSGTDARTGALRVVAVNEPVRFEMALPGNDAARVTLRGRADVWTGYRPEAAAAEAAPAAVTLHDGNLAFAGDASVHWRQVQGHLVRAAREIAVTEVTARTANAHLTLRGRTGLPISRAHPLDLTASIESQRLGEDLQSLLPAAQRDLVGELGLLGPGTLIARLRHDGPDDPEGFRAELDLATAELRPPRLPLPLSDCTARARVDERGFEVLSSAAQLPGDGHVAGTGAGAFENDQLASTWRVAGADIPLGAEIIAALPPTLRELLAQLRPSGKVGVTLDRLAGAGDQWEFAGTLRAEGDAKLAVGWPLTEINGRLDGVGRISSTAAPAGEAQLHIQSARFADRPINGLRATLRMRPADQWLYFDDLSAQTCGGRVAGAIRVNPSTKQFELDVEISDVRLAELLGRTGDAAPPGIVAGRVHLRGTAGDANGLRGEGLVLLRDVPFGGTPILEPVQAAAESQFRSTRADTAEIEVTFEWRGQEWEIHRADLSSRNLRLVGAGRWNFAADQLSLRLVGAHPRDVPRVAVLTDLLEGANRQLVGYRIEGSTAAPRVTIEPLPAIGNALRGLLGEE